MVSTVLDGAYHHESHFTDEETEVWREKEAARGQADLDSLIRSWEPRGGPASARPLTLTHGTLV